MRPVDMWMGTSLQSEDTIRGHKFYQSQSRRNRLVMGSNRPPPILCRKLTTAPNFGVT